MSRQLLYSELAILLEVGASLPGDIGTCPEVKSEYHSQPHISRKQWFNTDFFIELDNWDQDAHTKTSGVPIRPWSMAGCFYVQLTRKGIPTMLELLEGESLPMSSFREEICRVDGQ